MEVEIWKDVNGYEGIYQVSSFGRVKSLSRTKTVGNFTFLCKKELIRVLAFDNHGYLQLCLCKEGKTKTIKVHKIVAEAFLTKESKDLVVNHIDGNRTNNRASNLEYITRSENTNHGILKSKKPKTSKYSGVVKVDRVGRKIRWRVNVWSNGKSINLGYYDTEEEAANVYCGYINANGISNKYARTILSDPIGVR